MAVDRRLMETAVAVLLCEPQANGKALTQAQIAKRLGTNQPRVSRIIRSLCKHRKIEKVTITRPSPALTETPQWRQARQQLYKDEQIRDEMAAQSPHEDVFRLEVVGAKPPKSSSEFGRAAAPIVAGLLRNAHSVGVGCGRTLDAVARALPSLDALNDAGPARGRDLRIFPILGEPNHLQNRDQNPVYSASLVAEAMQVSLFGQIDRSMPVLRGVPAYIARRFRSDMMIEMFKEIPGYRRIFVGENAEIANLDTIISGVGVVSHLDDQMRGAMVKELLEQEQIAPVREDRITAERLNDVIDGEIAGILLPKRRSRESDTINDLNCGLVGLQEAHLQQVCDRTRHTEDEGRAAGVIVLAFGESKIPVVANAIRRGLLTTLVTSRDFARALNRHFRETGQEGP